MLLMYKASPRYQTKIGPPCGGPFLFGNGEGLNLEAALAAQVRVETGVAGRHN